MAFGELLLDQRRADWGTVYKYNGKELDCESGYYYYGARYYNPGLVRFLSVDPLVDKFPSQSPYLYAYNNPIRFIDIDGLYGDESEANKQREAAIAKGLKVGDVYQSGDEFGFNVINGYDSYSDFGAKSSFGKEGASNQTGGGFWSWLSNLFSLGSAQEGPSDGIEGLGHGGSLNAPDGSADRIIDYTEGFPGLNSSTLLTQRPMVLLKTVDMDLWRGAHTMNSVFNSPVTGLDVAKILGARRGISILHENKRDTQWINYGDSLFIQYDVKHHKPLESGFSRGTISSPIDTIKIN
jgi:RHS repeat-associated protein